MGKRPNNMLKANGHLLAAIESFFDYARPAQHQKILKSVLHAVQRNNYWKKRDPASLLEFIEVIQALIKAVYQYVKTVKKHKNEPFQAEISLDPVILNHFHAFFRFRKYKAWKKQCRLILHFALSATSHASLGAEIDLLGIYIQLMDLIEACHRLLPANATDKQA